MHEGAALVGAVDHLTHRLQGAHLVVGETDGNERSAGSDGVGVGASRVIHGSDTHAMALGLQSARGAQNRLVLGRPGHDRARRGHPPRRAEQGQVHAFGTRRGECDLGAAGAEGLRGEVASAIERRPGRPAFSVGARWVALREVAKCGGDLGEDGRAAGVVEKNSLQLRALAGPRAPLSPGCGRAGG